MNKKLTSGFVVLCTISIQGTQYPDAHIEGYAELLDGVVQDYKIDNIVVCNHCLMKLDPVTQGMARFENEDAINTAVQKFFWM